MDYGKPERADRLAAEYVVGSLRGAARRRFEILLPAHPVLRAAVRTWEQRLMPLAAQVAPQAPSPSVWRRIEARLGGATAARTATAAAALPWWRQLGVWRAASALAGGAALGLALLLGTPGPAQPPLVVVLSSTSADGSAAGPSFVAGISADGRSLITRPIQDVSLQPDRSFELWSVPGAGPPRSLGVISPRGATVVQRRQLLQGAAALAVSLEPVGGSPTGLPTGPVVFVGKLTS